MAYKFQAGDAVMSGALNQEDGITTTTLSASSTLEVVGDACLINDLNLSGTATVGGLTALANLDIGAFKMQALTFESDQATGTAPFTVASTTKVTNLNADKLDGSDWAAPAALGSGTPAAVTATTVSGTAATFTTLAGTSLALQNGGISAAGPIGGATTVSASGQTTLGANMLMSGDQYVGGALNVSGNTTLGDTSADVATVTARLTASQGGYFADRVGIGTATPHSSSILHLSYANAITPPQMIANDTYGGLRIENTNAAGGATIHMRSDDADGFITYHKTQNNRGDFHFHAEPYESALVISSSGDVLVPSGSLSGSSTLEIVGNAFFGAALNVTGAVTLAGPASGSAAGDGSFLSVDAAGLVVLDEPAGGGGSTSPGGSDTQVQFNNGGAFGGSSNLVWDDTNFKVVGNISGSGATTIGTSITATGPISGSGVGSFGSLVLDGAANLQSAGITNAGAIAGATTYSGSTSISADSLTLGSYGMATAGVLTIASMGGNWTNASRTVANGGTFTTIDINGGTIDGTTVGATTPSSVKATTLSGSSTLQVGDDSTFAGKVEPLVDDGYDIGSASKQWKDLYTAGDVKLSGVASGSQAGPSSFLAVNAAGILVLDEPAGGGGGGSPGGSDTQVQFNNGGAFGGSANLIWDDTNFKVTGNISGSGGLEAVGNTVLGGNLNVSGAQVVGALTGDAGAKTAGAYSQGASDYYIGCNSAGGDVTITLQGAAAAGAGRVLVIKDEYGMCTGSNTIVVNRAGSDTIDGAASQEINNGYGSLTLLSTGAGWAII